MILVDLPAAAAMDLTLAIIYQLTGPVPRTQDSSNSLFPHDPFIFCTRLFSEISQFPTPCRRIQRPSIASQLLGYPHMTTLHVTQQIQSPWLVVSRFRARPVHPSPSKGSARRRG
ncbi:hypothetical protein NXS19_005621 [Fusarium pseudograminearum]|nr:hypothetical protein NXS19_005621 [Fusarium pseudograminearum]